MASPVRVLPTPDSITSQEFHEALGRYPALVQAISETKGAKHGQRTLAELDHFRYVTAPELFGTGKAQRQMELDDVKVLVDWKLRHGKFRPTLMKLVSQNDPSTAEATVQDAVAGYSASKDATQAVEALSRLRGVGPATSSLLLAVHDPEKVIFFADEAYWWLCCGGTKNPLRYNIKEYQSLERAMKLLAGRLGAAAVDVERVAFVLMKHEEVAPFAAGVGAGAADDIGQLPELPRRKLSGRPSVVRSTSTDERKRKQSSPRSDNDLAAAPPLAAQEDTSLRRSKRGKRA